MSNNWNDPNAPQGDPNGPQNPEGWNQQPQQGWQPSAADQPQQGWGQPGQGDPYAAQQGDPYAAQAGGYVPTTGPYATTQMNYAPWGKRVLSFLIDYLPATLLFSLLMYLIFPNNYDVSSTGGGAAANVSGTPNFLSFAFMYLLWPILLAYWASTHNGQTWGKKIVGTRVVDAQGQVPSFGKLWARGALHFVDSICCIGYLFPLWDKRRQTLSDKIMGTYVVQA